MGNKRRSAKDEDASRPIVFTADVSADIAQKFDEIAQSQYRSRSAHLLYVIEKEANKFDEPKGETAGDAS